ncbi:unnamed protein product [Schistocephalus solidus]|uniref:ELMO domain-containing protein n=1 Tax=Schistocephalus solidus TaxID=70667 RepID=A0A183SX26_SCHSO|nr:unnamed protein product [Schistocephalus solidus]
MFQCEKVKAGGRDFVAQVAFFCIYAQLKQLQLRWSGQLVRIDEKRLPKDSSIENVKDKDTLKTSLMQLQILGDLGGPHPEANETVAGKSANLTLPPDHAYGFLETVAGKSANLTLPPDHAVGGFLETVAGKSANLTLPPDHAVGRHHPHNHHLPEYITVS